jgi:hypothetical protein
MTIDPALIFGIEPTWDDATTRFEYTRKTLILDSQTGLLGSTMLSPNPRNERIMRYILAREQVDDVVRDWIYDKWMGRWKGFWMPSWTADFPHSAAIDTLDETFECEGINRSDRWTVDQRRALVAIEPYQDGVRLDAQEIVDITKDTDYGVETVTMVGSFARSHPARRIISWLLWGRLNTDNIRIQWVEPNTAIMDLPFVELPGEAP